MYDGNFQTILMPFARNGAFPLDKYATFSNLDEAAEEITSSNPGDIVTVAGPNSEFKAYLVSGTDGTQYITRISTALPEIPFDGILETATVQAASAAVPSRIYFVKVVSGTAYKNTFACVSGFTSDTYYSNWTDRSEYCADAFGTPHTGVIYVNRQDGTRWIWDGENLNQIGGGEIEESIINLGDFTTIADVNTTIDALVKPTDVGLYCFTLDTRYMLLQVAYGSRPIHTITGSFILTNEGDLQKAYSMNGATTVTRYMDHTTSTWNKWYYTGNVSYTTGGSNPKMSVWVGDSTTLPTDRVGTGTLYIVKAA